MPDVGSLGWKIPDNLFLNEVPCDPDIRDWFYRDICDAVQVCCSVLQCVAVCCSVLQCVAVCCRVLQCVAMWCSVLQCVAVCCRVLQCVAVSQHS